MKLNFSDLRKIALTHAKRKCVQFWTISSLLGSVMLGWKAPKNKIWMTITILNNNKKRKQIKSYILVKIRQMGLLGIFEWNNKGFPFNRLLTDVTTR